MALKIANKVMRGFLLPAAVAVAPSDGHTLGLLCAKKTECTCKPSELPIYPVECNACKYKATDAPASSFETNIGKIRKELWVVQDGVGGYKQRVVDTINTGIAHTSSPGIPERCKYGRDHLAASLDWSFDLPSRRPASGVNYVHHVRCSVDFLREESNLPERSGAIAIATVTGYIFGLRGGAFKRLTYATVGGLSMAAVCYPRLAAEYSDLAFQEGQRYFVAGYHFIFGEQPKVPDWLNSVFNGKGEKK